VSSTLVSTSTLVLVPTLLVFVARVHESALPINDAVIDPASKSPEASLFTIWLITLAVVESKANSIALSTSDCVYIPTFDTLSALPLILHSNNLVAVVYNNNALL